MRKVSSYVLLKLLMKKSCFPTFKPKLFLIVSFYFYFQSYEESAFSQNFQTYKVFYTRTTLRHFTNISSWTLLRVSIKLFELVTRCVASFCISILQLENCELLFILLIYLNGEANLKKIWMHLYTYTWFYQTLKQIHYMGRLIHQTSPYFFLFASSNPD